mmetsp:Transcript_30706/g.51690  ORF Transcript_30706/g.51690 Transcript_30706/m.51690 type:complete len:214 (+) Transcript_30706:1490-2131(+)
MIGSRAVSCLEGLVHKLLDFTSERLWHGCRALSHLLLGADDVLKVRETGLGLEGTHDRVVAEAVGGVGEMAHHVKFEIGLCLFEDDGEGVFNKALDLREVGFLHGAELREGSVLGGKVETVLLFDMEDLLVHVTDHTDSALVDRVVVSAETVLVVDLGDHQGARFGRLEADEFHEALVVDLVDHQFRGCEAEHARVAIERFVLKEREQLEGQV